MFGIGNSLSPARAAEPPEASPPEISAAFSAVLKIRTKTLPDARTVSTLGTEREGSAVVIAPSGIVLTIRYLIIEAERIEVQGPDSRVIPAVPVAYDHAMGFGLLRPVLPLAVKPIELGRSPTSGNPTWHWSQPMVTHATLAYVVYRKPCRGYWEHLLEAPQYLLRRRASTTATLR